MFLLREFLKIFSLTNKKKRIGFVLDVLPIPYSLVMASTRMRVYDIILYFSKDKDFFLELYKPWKKYDAVIFQKAFRNEHFLLAKALKKKGVKIVLDLNTTVFNSNKNVQTFIRLTDWLLVSSPYLLNSAKKTFPQQRVSLIEEHIPDIVFSVQKNINPLPKTLVYAGYAQKASEIFNIENILKSFRKQHFFSILFLCEKDPRISIDGIECTFVKYHQHIVHKQLLDGDIFIAPRDLTDPTNYGHSFSKIGLPMAIGLPVIASPIPAYEGSPALLCATDKEWQDNLSLLFTNTNKRAALSKKGQLYCKNRYSTEKITLAYRNFLRSLTEEY